MCTVLIVEDYDDTREMLAETLRDEGCEVLEAENGERALALLDSPSTKQPCLVLLDLAMPVMSGTEMLQVLDARGRLDELPVVVLSAGGTPHEARKARAFLRKPADPRTLVRLVHDICGTEHLARSHGSARAGL
jgi:CheY-like chemotaxis protein